MSVSVRQGGPEVGNVPGVKEGSFCDLVDIRYELEGVGQG